MVPTSIFEAATLHMAVTPVCWCGHASSFNPFGLWWHFHGRSWNDGLVAARSRFWCRVCRSKTRRKVRPASLECGKISESDFTLPWPGSDEAGSSL